MIFKNGLEAVILAALQAGALHGYAIAKAIRQQSSGALKFGEGQLYPALHRLEDAGFVVATWENQDPRPPRKVYALTEAGQRELQQQVSRWQEFAGGVGRMLGGARSEVARGH